MQNILTHNLSGYSLSILTNCTVKWRNLWNQVQGKKKVALFVYRPIALQCMKLRYRHKTQHSIDTMKRLVGPLKKSATFFPSTLFNKTDVLIMKLMLYCKEWLLKLCVHVITKNYVKFWMNELDEIHSWVINQKLSDGNLLFLAECIILYGWPPSQKK